MSHILHRKNFKEFPLIAILGPTASGKTYLSKKISKTIKEKYNFQSEIINCDSIQVYKFLDIGSAKIPPEERENIPHHMIDIVRPDEDFSAGDFMEIGRKKIYEIVERGNIPIICGGTGFYFRSLVYGIFEGPEGDEKIRNRLKKMIDKFGTKKLYKLLKKVDPEYSKKISENDKNRIVRALEVYFLTKKPISYFHKKEKSDPIKGLKFFFYCLNPPREKLYEKINKRVDEMIEEGLLNEVKELLEKFPKDSKGFEAIGYREIISFLKGEIDLDRAVNLIKRNSRNYAKRQLTWFRKEKDVKFLNFFGSNEKAIETIISELKYTLDKINKTYSQ